MESMSSDIRQSDYNENKNILHTLHLNRQSPHENESENTTSKQIFMDLQEAGKAYKGKEFANAATMYKSVLQSLDNIKAEDEYYNKDTIQYMLCISLMESNDLKDLQDALEYLRELEHNKRDNVPAIYYALAKIHIKFYRFEDALKAINNSFALLNKDTRYQTWCIPGTCFILPESTTEGLLDVLMRLKDTVTEWNPPDAECFLLHCQHRTKYYLPSRHIYFSDPTFDGMVTVYCNNTKRSCELHFHQACWIFQKQEILGDEILDREIIGCPCFTLECNNGSYVITRIEIMSKYGEEKVIEAPRSRALIAQQSSIKGAIKKQYQNPYELKTPQMFEANKCGSQNSVTDEVSHTEKNGEVSNSEIDIYKDSFKITTQNVSGGGENSSDLPKINFTKDCYSEPFLYEFLYEYIQANGPTAKCDIFKKWDEINRRVGNFVSPSTNQNVIQILLDSRRVISIGDYVYATSAMNQTQGLPNLGTLQGNDDGSIETEEPKNFDDSGDIAKMIEDHIKANDTKLTREFIEKKDDDNLFIRESKGLVGDGIWGSKQYPDRFGIQSFSQRSSFNDSLKESVSANQQIDTRQALTKKSIATARIKALENNEQRESNEKDQNGVALEEFSKFMTDILDSKTTEPLTVFDNVETNVQRHQFKNKSIENFVTKDNMSQKNVLMCETGIKQIHQPNDHLQKSIKHLSMENEMPANKYFEKYESLRKQTENYEMQLNLKNKEINNLKEEMVKTKKELLRRLLDSQFSANQRIMLKNIEACNTSIQVIAQINSLFNEHFGFEPLSESEQWSETLIAFQKAVEMHQKDYGKIAKLLKLQKDTEEIDDIVFELKNIPEFPTKSLRETVVDAFHNYASQCDEKNKSLQHFTDRRDGIGNQFNAMDIVHNGPIRKTSDQRVDDVIRTIKYNPNYQLSSIENKLKSLASDLSRSENRREVEQQTYQLPDRNKHIVAHKKTDSENHRTLAMQKEAKQDGHSNRRSCKDIDKIMYHLRNNNPGIMDLDLLECLNKAKREFDDSFSNVPLGLIIEVAERQVLQIQRKYLCLYESSGENISLGKQEEQFISNQMEYTNPHQPNQKFGTQYRGMGRGANYKTNKKFGRGHAHN